MLGLDHIRADELRTNTPLSVSDGRLMWLSGEVTKERRLPEALTVACLEVYGQSPLLALFVR